MDKEAEYGSPETFNWADYFNNIANEIEALRIHICAYRADEHHMCDCKYGLAKSFLSSAPIPRFSEKTGCPELRDLVRGYRELANVHASS